MPQRRVLVLFAHPVLERSRVNARLAAGLAGLDAVTVHDLYERYPTLAIDVPAEQALLAAHDAVVFQHPFYWYSTPAILKEWQDLVLEYGWAYGHGGDALRGKLALSAITTGGAAAAYQHGGYNRYTVRELLAPLARTAHLCGMRYLGPFVVHSALRISSDADAASSVSAYRRLVVALRDDTLDLTAAAAAPTLNDLVSAPPEEAPAR